MPFLSQPRSLRLSHTSISLSLSLRAAHVPATLRLTHSLLPCLLRSFLLPSVLFLIPHPRLPFSYVSLVPLYLSLVLQTHQRTPSISSSHSITPIFNYLIIYLVLLLVIDAVSRFLLFSLQCIHPPCSVDFSLQVLRLLIY